MDYPHDFDMVLNTFQIAPRLRSLQTEILSSILTVPYDQLENLCLRLLRRNDCLDWLLRCPNLAECEIHPYDFEGPGFHPPVTAHLPRLTKLRINAIDDDLSLETLLDGLVTPVLSELYVQQTIFNAWAQESFISFIQRSACSIRKLDIIGIQVMDAQLIECLHMVPSLVELRILGPRPTFPPVSDLISTARIRSFHPQSSAIVPSVTGDHV